MKIPSDWKVSLDDINETFNAFKPGPLTVDGQEGKWLTISTDTPGKHRFTNEGDLPPEDYLGGLIHVAIDGPGIVTFKPFHPRSNLMFAAWSSNGLETSFKARFFGPDNATIKEYELSAMESHFYGHLTDLDNLIAGVDISILNPEGRILSVDNFLTANQHHVNNLTELMRR
ncbi:hypothetical protein C8J98_10218 [Luteibacter sp. OK325]|nr:hypothetical protein C8J98_10218 [Luteibacter sp. OK325]